MLCLGSRGIDGVISELCYKGTNLQRNFRKMTIPQDSHRLEKYLNIQDCLEKSLKIKFALKST